MRLAARKGSIAVANAIIVNSGTRKKTIDRLTLFLALITHLARPDTGVCRCRFPNSLNSKTHSCQWYGLACEKHFFGQARLGEWIAKCRASIALRGSLRLVGFG